MSFRQTCSYLEIIASDIVIMAIPTYSDAPSSIYFAWRERSQGFFTSNDVFEQYQKVIKGYIIIGNQEAGGAETFRIVFNHSENPKKCYC